MKTALDIFETLDRLNKKEASADKIAVAACMLCDFFGAEIRAALAPAPPQADTPIKGAGEEVITLRRFLWEHSHPMAEIILREYDAKVSK